MKRSEGFFEGFNEMKLYFQTWEPEGPSRGLLVLTHGQGEHSECYLRLVNALESSGWTILAWDLRGHGRSEGQRGFALSFLDYVRDFEVFWKEVVSRYQTTNPTVFFAHSLGGLIQLKAFSGIQGATSQAQILSSPFLGLALEVPPYKEAAAHVLRNWLPHLTLSNEIRNDDLTRDPMVLEEFSRDPLRHNKISSGVYLGAQECQPALLAKPQIWKGPWLLLLAENDPVVSTKVNLQFFERLEMQHKTCVVFENRKHELINDLGREEVFDRIRDFLAQLST